MTSTQTTIQTITPTTPAINMVPSPEVFPNENSSKRYETVLSIPAGKIGLPYQGIGVSDMEITGPNAFGILSDGRFVITDPIENRLLFFSSTGKQLKTIDLSSVGILNISDLQIYHNELFALEIFLGPPLRYRINHLSQDGKLISYVEIPDGYHLENGLTGFIIDCEGKLFLEIGGNLQPLPVAGVTLTSTSNTDAYECNGQSYVVQNELNQKPRIYAGTMTLETSLTYGLGGLSLLKVMPDGSFFIVRSDVVNDKQIQVDDTVHFISAKGDQLGVARVPVDDRYYYVMRNLTVGPDGNIYCLLPRPDSLEILRLKFYTSLEPLMPGGQTPAIFSEN